MSKLFSFFSLALLSTAQIVLAETCDDNTSGTVEYPLNIYNAMVSPDGYERSAVTAGGGVIGSLIHGKKGDRFLINVTDSLNDPSMRRSTSVHWHGITQKHSTEMDGAALVSQCPIVPGHSFLYNFTVPDQTGTYWYHSHVSTQYCDGLRGPLIIYDPEDPHKDLYDVDDESTVITLNDWYHKVAPSAYPGTTGRFPLCDSTLINGRGRWYENPTSNLSVIRAQPGKRHRFRLINMSCDPAYTFSIDGHKMTIIEADGVETEPVTVDSLKIFASQRYSVVVTMDKPVDNYWIRAIPSISSNSTTEDGLNSAILRYDGAPDEEPCTSEDDDSTDLIEMNESDLHPLINPGAPGEPYIGGADLTLNLSIAFQNGSYYVNNATFKSPSVPVLLQILSGSTNAHDLLPSGSVYTLPLNKTIEIVIPGGGNHPFHLHGHVFDIVRVAGNSTYNYANPVRRDTVNIGGGDDLVTFRFRTDNPGPYFLHCHIDWHLEAGLAVVFAEAPEEVKSHNEINDDWYDLCPIYNQNNPDLALQSTK